MRLPWRQRHAVVIAQEQRHPERRFLFTYAGK
jgi:hypothetical protein